MKTIKWGVKPDGRNPLGDPRLTNLLSRLHSGFTFALPLRLRRNRISGGQKYLEPIRGIYGKPILAFSLEDRRPKFGRCGDIAPRNPAGVRGALLARRRVPSGQPGTTSCRILPRQIDRV